MFGADPAVASNCAVTSSQVDKILREKDAFSYEEFTKYEQEAQALLARGRSGRSRIQIELSKPGVTLESLFPKSAVGTAAYYQAFANYGNKGKVVDIGRILANEASLPPGAKREVAALKRYLIKNPFLKTELKTDSTGRVLLLPAQKNRQWHNVMMRFATLNASIQQYVRLGEVGGVGAANDRSWHTKLVANKLTAGFLRFINKRRGAEVQRKLIETQLARSNFAEALEVLGLYNNNAASLRFRQGIEKYSNLTGNAFRATIFGGAYLATQGAVSSIGLPISVWNLMGNSWAFIGFAPLVYRYNLPLSSRKSQQIIESVRKNGYERGIAPYKKSLFVHRGLENSSILLRRAFLLSLTVLVGSFLQEHGDEVVGGIRTAAAYQAIFADRDKLVKSEESENGEDIRIKMIEEQLFDFPISFGDEYDIHPESRYEWERYLRSISFCAESIVPNLVKFICENKGAVKGWEAEQQFVESRYNTVIQKNDLNPDLVRICATQVFWLWQNADVDRDIRAFSDGSTKVETDFCEENYRPKLFKSGDFMKRILANF